MDIFQKQIKDQARVLIIEDDAILAMDLSYQVEALGHIVTGIARTRAQAVRIARRSAPDLIISDVQLADQSCGIDTAGELFALFPDLPVIFATGHSDGLCKRCDIIASQVLSKPYSEAQIENAIRSALG